MLDDLLLQLLLLIGAALAAVMLLQRMGMPSSLGYLVVGALLGPHALDLAPDADNSRRLAEFGIVFLLFTTGLTFSLPRILAMRNQVFGLGTAQVFLTSVVIGVIAWLVGLDPVPAFVVGAVFAQSSTTVMSKQLTDQGEEETRHGRLGIAMSVFQDVTAVPLLVLIMVLSDGGGDGNGVLLPLGIAMVKLVAAIAIIYLAGSRILRPLFHRVAARRSAEMFTLAVLLATLTAAAVTNAFGLSLALGAFLAGMLLGDTEFRHQIESTIRPFRDVLVGLFFVTVGMLADFRVWVDLWGWIVAAAAVLLGVKVLLVTAIVRWSGIDLRTSLRIGIVLAVGGEFGLALLSIALGSEVIDPHNAQIALNAVLLSIAAAPFFIRHNGALAERLTPAPLAAAGAPTVTADMPAPEGHIIICGYGRIGQSVSRLLQQEQQAFIALDSNPALVREAHTAGQPVFYGDAGERDILEAVGLMSARLLVISLDDLSAARKILVHARALRPGLPILVRARDESTVEELTAAGATEVVAETLEAGLMIAAQVLLLAGVAPARVSRLIVTRQQDRYQLIRELFDGDDWLSDVDSRGHLHSTLLPAEARAVGRRLGEIELPCQRVQAVVRGGEPLPGPLAEVELQPEDVVVLFGDQQSVEASERMLLLG
jgi:CPA2 family monovalent cation:H+ antiporter-2